VSRNRSLFLFFFFPPLEKNCFPYGKRNRSWLSLPTLSKFPGRRVDFQLVKAQIHYRQASEAPPSPAKVSSLPRNSSNRAANRPCFPSFPSSPPPAFAFFLSRASAAVMVKRLFLTSSRHKKIVFCSKASPPPPILTAPLPHHASVTIVGRSFFFQRQ